LGKSQLLSGFGDWEKNKQQEVLRMTWRANLVAQFFDPGRTDGQVGFLSLGQNRLKSLEK
jgi:hypothetical protein